MEYTTLGNTGMEVSKICLGCNSFGDRHEWMLDKEESHEIIERAIELGINFFDTANNYSFGKSEEILGEALQEYDRDKMIVGSKVYFQVDPDNPNSGGLSRKTIMQELDNTLERLGLDTLDLFQIHRWDEDTDIEVTMRALNEAIHQEKTRYVGASTMWAHQFAEALHTSDSLGLERFATMQNHYNLVYREEEREMLPLCNREGIGVMTWSPLARGFLARPHEETTTTRTETDDILKEREAVYRSRGGEEINERVAELAAEKGVSMAQISLSWQLHKDWINTPIVGTTSVEHLEDAVEAVDISLSDSDIEYLEEPYKPVRVLGHS
jgi:aryl-alcohol dehydrogenase-like predicted oxidoreductase